MDTDALVDAFEEAEGARLIAPVKGDGNLAFSHELIRQTLLADLSTLKRERLHLKPPTRSNGATPTTLRSTPQTSPTTYPGPADWPIGPGWCATSRSPGSGRPTRLPSTTLSPTSSRPCHCSSEATQETRAELLERLAMALRSVGRWDDALSTMNEALDLYQALGRTDALGRLSWAMVSQLAWTARVQKPSRRPSARSPPWVTSPAPTGRGCSARWGGRSAWA